MRGTEEVLRLASRNRAKPLHFVSTTAIFGDEDADRVVREGEEPLRVGALATGYARSKWVAERLVVAARSRGLPVMIARPGNIAGHSETSARNGVDALGAFMGACLGLGLAPELDMAFDFAPVDYVSRALVCLSTEIVDVQAAGREWLNCLPGLARPLNTASCSDDRIGKQLPTPHGMFPLRRAQPFFRFLIVIFHQ